MTYPLEDLVVGRHSILDVTALILTLLLGGGKLVELLQDVSLVAFEIAAINQIKINKRELSIPLKIGSKELFNLQSLLTSDTRTRKIRLSCGPQAWEYTYIKSV